MMKTFLLGVILAAGSADAARSTCAATNTCQNAIKSHSLPLGGYLADCSSYLSAARTTKTNTKTATSMLKQIKTTTTTQETTLTTVIGETISIENKRRDVAASTPSLPAYATRSCNAIAYASACSCLGASVAKTVLSTATKSTTSTKIYATKVITTKKTATVKTTSTMTLWPDPTFAPGNDDFVLDSCYLDDDDDSTLLSTFVDASDDMTVDKCIEECADYLYAGLENGNECWCGDELSREPVLLDQEECNAQCAGSPLQFCGEFDSLLLYGPPPST